MLLGLGDVRGDVGILGRLKVRPPPIPNRVLDGPLGGCPVSPTQRLSHQPLQALDLKIKFELLHRNDIHRVKQCVTADMYIVNLSTNKIHLNLTR